MGGGTIATLPVNFEVVSSQDYNGDGSGDLVWLNKSNGTLSEWFLNGFTYVGGDEAVGTLTAAEAIGSPSSPSTPSEAVEPGKRS